MNLLVRLYRYQHERFPLLILIFTTSVTVLCSAAILEYRTGLLQGLLAFVAVLCFLYHIRVIDESRDFSHDAANHPDRPVQRGLVRIKELFLIDLVAIASLCAISIASGIDSIIMALVIFAFTTLAWRDFFLHEFFDKRPLLYHIVNSPQLVLIQLYIYTVLKGSLVLTGVMAVNLLFVWNNNFILELVRKIRIPSEESKVPDTYSFTMGFRNALILAAALCLGSAVVYGWIILATPRPAGYFIFFSLPLLFLNIAALLAHGFKKKKSTEKLAIASALLTYVGLNTLICIFNL